MAQRFTSTQLLIAGTTFAGGIVLGLLFVPRRRQNSRKPVSSHGTEIADWVDPDGRATINQDISQIQQLRSNVRHGIRRHVPDLYEATEHITFV